MSEKYFGKYRGTVLNNIDPENAGRIQAQVWDSEGNAFPAYWATPCVPINLPEETGSALPKIGASVWIEFECGDPNYPIWSGCFYGPFGDTPPALRSV